MPADAVVLATRNEAKLRELSRILGTTINVTGLEEFPGAPNVPETGATFEENALLKARAIAAFTRLPAVADDSGLTPVPIADYPVQLAALNRTFLNVVELTVHAALEEKRSHVYQAAALDPNTGATLALPAIHALCDDLIEAHGDLIPAGIRQRDPVPGARRLSVVRPADSEGEA